MLVSKLVAKWQNHTKTILFGVLIYVLCSSFPDAKHCQITLRVEQHAGGVADTRDGCHIDGILVSGRGKWMTIIEYGLNACVCRVSHGSPRLTDC